jgi:solute carrier family 35, member C2
MYNNPSIGCAVVPTALATALDINLSNISLVFITVTFATMV